AAAGVDVGRVDEVDAAVDRRADDALGVALLQAADLAPHAFVAAAEGHRAEAEFGNEEARASERVEFHRRASVSLRPWSIRLGKYLKNPGAASIASALFTTTPSRNRNHDLQLSSFRRARDCHLGRPRR